MNQYLKQAVELAIKNVEVGRQPFGAVLVANDKVLATGVNTLDTSFDISDHAEMKAIRQAQVERQSLDLSDATMYASGEPCPMCLGAIYFSGIKTIYYAGSVEDAAQVGLGLSVDVYQELTLPKKERSISFNYHPIEDQEQDPFYLWQKKNKHL